MSRFFRFLSTCVVAALLAALGVAGSTGSAFAYGAADRPLAQIEVSANCNNPSVPLCQPRPAGLGLGGVWLWIEIDAGGSGDVAGAGCGHVRGVGGGADPIRGDITWSKVFIPPGVFPYWTDPTNTYYLVVLGPGEAFPFPVTAGHYSYTAGPGVRFNLQVAP